MISAEVLKLQRNRALMAFAFVLTTGVLLIMFGYVGIQHASDPTKQGPAGGLDGFSHSVRILGVFFGMLAAVLIGAEAGTADVSSGVFRDLVATGRSRLALFLVRAPAAILVTLTFSAIGFAVALAGTFLLAGPLPTPEPRSAGCGLDRAGQCNRRPVGRRGRFADRVPGHRPDRGNRMADDRDAVAAQHQLARART